MMYFFKQKTAYEMRISDWSSDVSSSDLGQSSLDRLISSAVQARKSTEGRRYAKRLRDSSIVNKIAAGRLTFEWTEITLVSDDPAKGVGDAQHSDLLFPQLMALDRKSTRLNSSH